MRAMVRSVSRVIGVIAIFGSLSCGDVARLGRSPVMLVIDEIEAAPGTDPTTLGGFLLSDVQTLVQQQVNGQAVRVATIFNDVGLATLRLVMKDQGTGGLGVSPSDLNAVTLNRYHINYRRADGRNTPGVDVPYPIDGGLGVTVLGPTEVGFELVRHQAKLEQPLRSIAGFGGRIFISTIAEITFYGVDLAGNEVQATGNISVSFGDYADPD